MNKSLIIALVSALLSGHISIEASIPQAQNQLPTDVYELTDEEGRKVFADPRKEIKYTPLALNDAFIQLLTKNNVEANIIGLVDSKPFELNNIWIELKQKLPLLSYRAFLGGLILSARYLNPGTGRTRNPVDIKRVLIYGTIIAQEYYDNVPCNIADLAQKFSIQPQVIMTNINDFMQAIQYNYHCLEDEWECFPHIEALSHSYDPKLSPREFYYSNPISDETIDNEAEKETKESSAGAEQKLVNPNKCEYRPHELNEGFKQLLQMQKASEEVIEFFDERPAYLYHYCSAVRYWLPGITYNTCLSGLILTARIMGIKNREGRNLFNKKDIYTALLVGTMLAHKYFDDQHYGLASFAKFYTDMRQIQETLEFSEAFYWDAIEQDCNCSQEEWKCFPDIENVISSYDPSFRLPDSVDATSKRPTETQHESKDVDASSSSSSSSPSSSSSSSSNSSSSDSSSPDSNGSSSSSSSSSFFGSENVPSSSLLSAGTSSLPPNYSDETPPEEKNE